MVYTKNFTFPSDEELEQQELNISYPYIKAAAFFIGKRCEWYNNEYTLCRYELKDPRKCLKEGKDITNCALEVFQDIKKNCRNEFQAHVDCMLASSLNGEEKCGKTQGSFDKCMKEKLNIERPYYGYFCEAKVHDSPRPKPEPRKEPVFPNRLPDPAPAPYPPPRHGWRGLFAE
ncbi:NADH dehydrogenase [ubiquinone] 1 alpha subcomplex subunit 8 [Habropoda laboriosa]|uniref:NADH dehydrogenase [ubiquinone] 1 alpha subcomplex subunit 8 n=1 Tax=Habropoda laboriosa TaxID=597456 RepID=A0A0L7R0N7_9HYME|nr:PREDICTED: NADH dehydrogenase [ubiquinone] 1 alpha subcomplex subunit 8 [Habropoda laboriosa]KOC64420.1 NADH dehydrogenase [ubiquinone] 1 alpha subcomplex subunit 8 [Habropoda laboriosa]